MEREKAADITVILGNPPYNVGQQNENDNNKNRKYPVVDQRIRDTYAKDSSASTNIKLYDPYVRFFRWATDRLGGRDGIVCYISNNSFVDQNAFDGMRKHLLQDFTAVYHLNLRGNVRQNPKLSGTQYNVFGIQVGVGITIAVRKSGASPALYYHEVPLDWRRHEKLDYLARAGSMAAVPWGILDPDTHNTWLTLKLQSDYETFPALGSKEAKFISAAQTENLFHLYSLGIVTSRDEWLYDFDPARLVHKVAKLADHYNAEVSRWQKAGKPRDIDAFVDYTHVKWSEGLKLHLRRSKLANASASHVRRALYRPFCAQYVHFDDVLVQRRFRQHLLFPKPTTEAENRAIWVKVGSEVPMFALMIDQYLVRTDQRSGITSDPNRLDDEEYIVRLVGKVVTVSLETVRTVAALPALEIEP